MKKKIILSLIILSINFCMCLPSPVALKDNNGNMISATASDALTAVKMLSNLDKVQDMQVLPSNSHTHSYTETVLTEPTCTVDGEKEYKCSCGHSYTEPIKATGEHVYKTEVVQVADCEHEGILKYTCGCGDNYEKKFPKKEHKYESKVTKESTCTEKGVKTYSCKLCGDTYYDNIAALGHDEGEWVITSEATFFTDGIKEKHCKRCDEILESEIINSTIHNILK